MICQNEGVYTIGNLLKIKDFNDVTLLKNVNGLGYKTKEGIFLDIQKLKMDFIKNGIKTKSNKDN